jgi:signal transduction histidine kinase
MQAHGGQIEVASPVMAGRGALFTLTFPRAKATP